MSTVAAARPVRARLGRWPFDDEVVHLSLLDHHMVPTATDVAGWMAMAAARNARLLRTGALFPNSVEAFLEAGFEVADTLALLVGTPAHLATAHLSIPHRSGAHRSGDEPNARMRRLRPSMLSEAAAIDRRAFPAPWANDAIALGDILAATPHHRSRSVHVDGRMVAFCISGRADQYGYIQRLAVDPTMQRRGFALTLLDDAVRWMIRRDVQQVMLNTAVDNLPALALYESIGLHRQADPLLVLELSLR